MSAHCKGHLRFASFARRCIVTWRDTLAPESTDGWQRSVQVDGFWPLSLIPLLFAKTR